MEKMTPEMTFKPLASSSAGNAYLVSDGKTDLLIECGIPWRKIREALNFKTSKLSACLISHKHQDHCRAAKDVARAGIDIYSSPETLKALSENGIPDHRLNPLEGLHERIGSWNVLGLRSRHDVPCIAFLMASGKKKLLYLVDTPFPAFRFQTLTHIAIECNYSKHILYRNVESGKIHTDLAKRIIQNHMSLERCVSFLKSTDLKRVKSIWLLHLSSDNSDEEFFKQAVARATGKPVYVAGI